MLKGIPEIISPELLMELAQMGHGDEICIADGNFPGHTFGKKVIRLDGHGVPEILKAILQLMPLDSYVDKPVILMQKVSGDTVQTPIWDVFKKIVSTEDDRGDDCFDQIERFDFYERVKQSSVVVMTGEKALYANIILKKGVVIQK